jgi:probable rRNA maturation factor
MPDSAITLDFRITHAAWRRLPRLRARMQAAALATSAHLPASLRIPSAATILLTGDAKVRQLNFDFRGIDKPTNVLSFPQFSPTEIRRLGKNKEIVELGDIALAYQTVAAESKKESKFLMDHATHLVIHGLLHLLGYNHEQETFAKRMEKAEGEIMKSLGLSDPYAPSSEENIR